MNKTGREFLPYEERILDMLRPMYGVRLENGEEGTFYIFKNGKKLGKIKGDKVYLMDKNGEFEKVPNEVVESQDEFLRCATQAFWSILGKK